MCTQPEALEAACRVRLLPGTGHLEPNGFPSRRFAERIGPGDKEPDLRHFLSGTGQEPRQGAEGTLIRSRKRTRNSPLAQLPRARKLLQPETPAASPKRPRSHLRQSQHEARAGSSQRARPRACTAPCTWPGPCPWWPASPPPARAAPPSSPALVAPQGRPLLTAGGVRSSLETAGREDQHRRRRTHTFLGHEHLGKRLEDSSLRSEVLSGFYGNKSHMWLLPGGGG